MTAVRIRFAACRLIPLLTALGLALQGCGPGPNDEQATELRNRGVAELENERPQQAEKTFMTLSRIVQDDPLPNANLAVARLRQQEFSEAMRAIEAALKIAPGRFDLLAIQAEILRWEGRLDEALELYAEAAAIGVNDVHLQFAAFSVADSLESDKADAVAAQVLGRLHRLRPDNLAVVLARLKQALNARDRNTASAAALRIGELMWQASPVAARLYSEIEAGLNADDLANLARPLKQLENVLKATPMYKQGRRELSNDTHGSALLRFADEPQSGAFGESVPVRFAGSRLIAVSGIDASLMLADLDGDQLPEILWHADNQLVVANRKGSVIASLDLPQKVSGLKAYDLNNDDSVELYLLGSEGLRVVEFSRGSLLSQPGLIDRTPSFVPDGMRAQALVALDYDIEGDLDLAVGGPQGVELLRNNLDGPLVSVGERALPETAIKDTSAMLASDLDRDGDLDLLVAGPSGLAWFDNLRQGTFQKRHLGEHAMEITTARSAVSADLDNDGYPEIIAVGDGMTILRNSRGVFQKWPKAPTDLTGELTSVIAFDANNDGRLDLALGGPGMLKILVQQQDAKFAAVQIDGAPQAVTGMTQADMDGDGDLDLLIAAHDGIHLLDNIGGNQNAWLAVQLRGLAEGNSKNNVLGLGSSLELRNGAAYQFREVDSQVTHFGLGRAKHAELLRVVWTNGVPQNRLDVKRAQTIVEEQKLKGSCPFLYVWDGEKMRFVTDLLWGSPAGLPLAPGVWAPADPGELVKVRGARPRGGVYDLRITEELWEAAFFDQTRLWIVDHPPETEVASNLRIVPGAAPAPEAVLAAANLQAPLSAWDGRGQDVSEQIRERDGIYASGWEASKYQGVAASPWTFTLDIGEAPATAIRLFMDGWIFPADASLNLAVAQREDLPYTPPRLEVEVDGSWQVLMGNMGFPAGKTKTMVVDTPPLPAGATRIRIVSNLWLAWDRIAWTTQPADSRPSIVAKLDPSSAELRFRGYSEMKRSAPNAPHAYAYDEVSVESPWLAFPGRYTRYGEVRELLLERDDRMVILAAGDEMALQFDASDLEPPPTGWTRTVFLESFGWDKDADRNTYAAEQVEPLPFGAMSGYPYGADEAFPDTPEHRAYRRDWLTRVVPPTPGAQASTANLIAQ